ncbi:MAG: hypothetical protein JWR88_1130, partial [Pseudonocardia sp.]|nr:hypothetical protein [Pseudonocardia sp.]
ARAAIGLAALLPPERRAIQQALTQATPQVQPHLRRSIAAGHSAAEVLALAAELAGRPASWLAERLSVITDEPGAQDRAGARVDPVDGTTGGTTVLLALAANADPLASLALTGDGFGERFEEMQRRVHRQSTRFWPAALGSSPWGMVAWLRRDAPGVGPYRVRLVDDSNPGDITAVIAEVEAALDRGDPVPLLIGTAVPRHYTMATGRDESGWRVFEPSSGEVRIADPAAIAQHRLGRLLGFDHLHAVLLPVAGR